MYLNTPVAGLIIEQLIGNLLEIILAVEKIMDLTV